MNVKLRENWIKNVIFIGTICLDRSKQLHKLIIPRPLCSVGYKHALHIHFVEFKHIENGHFAPCDVHLKCPQVVNDGGSFCRVRDGQPLPHYEPIHTYTAAKTKWCVGYCGYVVCILVQGFYFINVKRNGEVAGMLVQSCV